MDGIRIGAKYCILQQCNCTRTVVGKVFVGVLILKLGFLMSCQNMTLHIGFAGVAGGGSVCTGRTPLAGLLLLTSSLISTRDVSSHNMTVSRSFLPMSILPGPVSVLGLAWLPEAL